MSIFDKNVIEKKVELDDNNRTDLLLDYAFNQYCDWLLLNHESSRNVYMPVSNETIKSYFKTNFQCFFSAMKCACPMWWWPDWLAPYEILYLKSISFEEKGNCIDIIITYKVETSESPKTKIFIYNKEWLNIC